jgi:predicted ATP-binding protein involved in virulence
MKINRLKIKGLFDLFDYDLDFTNEENLKIITGPNGFGKTMILNILYSLFNRQFSFFHKLVFEQIEVFFENDYRVEITKKEAEAPEETKLNQSPFSQNNNFVPPDFKVTEEINTKKTNSKEVIAKYYKKDNFDTYQVVFIISFRLKSENEVTQQSPQQILPHILFAGNGKWFDKRLGTELTFEEMIFLNLSLIPEGYISEQKPILVPIDAEPSFLVSATTQISDFIIHSKVYLIKEQRLVKEEIRPSSFGFTRDPELLLIPSIEKHRNELKILIENKEKEHSKISQELDSSFPKRLVESSKDLTVEKFTIKSNEVKEKQKLLKEYGLSDTGQSVFDINKNDENNFKILSVYLEDSLKKLSVFDDLLEKIRLFVDIVNKRLNFKHIEIDSEKGFICRNDKGTILPLEDLSSGEKHQIVLLYELIFKTTENTLLLIDEPEISLHVAWQKEFIDDLLKIIKLKNIQAIVATHSLQIINRRWDLEIDLVKQKN